MYHYVAIKIKSLIKIVVVCKVVTLHNIDIDYNPVIGIDRWLTDHHWIRSQYSSSNWNYGPRWHLRLLKQTNSSGNRRINSYMYIKTSTRVFACIHNYDSWHTRVSLIRCSEMKWKQTPITTYTKTVYKVQRYRFNSVVIILVTLINTVVTINALGGVSAFYIYVHPYPPNIHTDST